MIDDLTRDPDDHSSRVYPFEGDLLDETYRLRVSEAVVTGGLRYTLVVSNGKLPKPDTDNGGGGEDPPPPPLVPIMVISPDSIRFVDTPVDGTSPPEALMITNTGTATLLIEDMFFSGSGWQIFDAENPAELPNLPIAIEPGFAKGFLLNFFPTAPTGEKTGTLTVVANVLTSPRTVGLSGLATVPGPIPPPAWEWLWLGGYAPGKTSSFAPIRIQFPALQAGDLALVALTWRGGERWNIPTGWDVRFEANDGLISPGSRVSTLILTRTIQAGDPLAFDMTPRLGNSAIPRALAFSVAWRPKTNAPNFVALSDATTGEGERTFSAPSLNIARAKSLIFCVASLGSFEDDNRTMYPFSAVGLGALPSIPISQSGGDYSVWRWGHVAHTSDPAGGNICSMELYMLQPVPAGPTGNFVGEAQAQGVQRLIAIAFDGPT